MSQPETDFYVLAWGLVAMSVCTSLPRKDVSRRANLEHPTGISSGWVLSRDKAFHTGEANPHGCERFTTHKHYLLHC